MADLFLRIKNISPDAAAAGEYANLWDSNNPIRALQWMGFTIDAMSQGTGPRGMVLADLRIGPSLGSGSRAVAPNGAVSTQFGTAATGTVTYSASSGAQTITIGGVSTGSISAAGSDALQAIAGVNAINASATLSQYVTASVDPLSNTRVLIVANTDPFMHVLGNAIALSVTGTGATASGALLGTGGTAVAGVNCPAASINI